MLDHECVGWSHLKLVVKTQLIMIFSIVVISKSYFQIAMPTCHETGAATTNNHSCQIVQTKIFRSITHDSTIWGTKLCHNHPGQLSLWDLETCSILSPPSPLYEADSRVSLSHSSTFIQRQSCTQGSRLSNSSLRTWRLVWRVRQQRETRGPIHSAPSIPLFTHQTMWNMLHYRSQL